jgi:uncharacterized RDD family membrane protein YckC
MSAEVEESQIMAVPLPSQRMARVGDRAFAMFLDLFVFFPLLYLSTAAIGIANGTYKNGTADFVGGAMFLPILIDTIIWIAFYVVSEYFFKGSPGKHVMGIKVASKEGGRIGFLQSVVRNLLRLIDAIGFYALGFVVVLCSKQGQRIGDLAAKTLVLEKDDSRRIDALVVLVVLVIALYGASAVLAHIVR